jgi:hypothetical protein
MSVTVLQPLKTVRIAPSAQNCENRFISNGIGYANSFSRFNNAVIRVYDKTSNVIEHTSTLTISKSGSTRVIVLAGYVNLVDEEVLNRFCDFFGVCFQRCALFTFASIATELRLQRSGSRDLNLNSDRQVSDKRSGNNNTFQVRARIF